MPPTFFEVSLQTGAPTAVSPGSTEVPSTIVPAVTEAPTAAPAEAQWFTKTETDATGKEWTIVPGPDGSPVDAESLTNGTTINLVRRSMLTNDVLTDVPPTADNFIQYSFYRMKGVTDQPFSHITENNDSYVQAYAPGDKNAIDYGNNWPSLDENIIWNLAVRWKHPAVDFANFPAYSTANGNTLAPDVNQLVKDLANNKVILPIDLPGGTKYYNAHDATIIQVPMASLASDPEAFGSFLKFKYAVVDGGDSQANPGKLVIYEAVPAGYLNPEKTDVTLFGPYYYALMDRSLANADSADFITDDMSLPRRHGSTLTAAAFSDLQSQIEYHAMYGDAYNGKPAFWTTSK
jgi:hypothetical protein